MKQFKTEEGNGIYMFTTAGGDAGDTWKVTDAVKTAPVTVSGHAAAKMVVTTRDATAAATVFKLLQELGYDYDAANSSGDVPTGEPKAIA